MSVLSSAWSRQLGDCALSNELTTFLTSSAITPRKIGAAAVLVVIVLGIIGFFLLSRGGSES